MADKRNTLRLSYELSVASGGTGLITSKPVEAGQMQCVQSIAFRNKTGTRGIATFLVLGKGVQFELQDVTTVTANTWYNYPYEQHIMEGECIAISQASCNSADALELRILGYTIFQ